ncbi:hypothetical protein T484DRAFT_2023963 [Baffinella frigidus]|nr:hypothetical protein T484DRAFT_2023963 [Cryptophyta sp. CCMP2293]
MRKKLLAPHSWRLVALLFLQCIRGCWQSGAGAWVPGSPRFHSSEPGGTTLEGAERIDAGTPEMRAGVSGMSRTRWPVLATRGGRCLRLRGGAIMHNDQKVVAAAKLAKKAKSAVKIQKWQDRYAAKHPVLLANATEESDSMPLDSEWFKDDEDEFAISDVVFKAKREARAKLTASLSSNPPPRKEESEREDSEGFGREGGAGLEKPDAKEAAAAAAAAEQEADWLRTKTGPHTEWEAALFDGVDMEGSARGHEADEDALEVELEKMLEGLARRVQAGPIYPKSGPAGKGWDKDDHDLHPDQADVMRTYGFHPAQVRSFLDMAKYLDKFVMEQAEEELNDPSKNPDQLPQHYKLFQDASKAIDAAFEDKGDALKKFMRDRGFDDQAATDWQSNKGEGPPASKKKNKAGPCGGTKSTRKTDPVAEDLEARRRRWEAQARFIEGLQPEELNVRGKVTGMGGAMAIIVNKNIFVPTLVLPRPGEWEHGRKVQKGDRVSMDLARVTARRQAGMDFGKCEYVATRVTLRELRDAAGAGRWEAGGDVSMQDVSNDEGEDGARPGEEEEEEGTGGDEPQTWDGEGFNKWRRAGMKKAEVDLEGLAIDAIDMEKLEAIAAKEGAQARREDQEAGETAAFRGKFSMLKTDGDLVPGPGDPPPDVTPELKALLLQVRGRGAPPDEDHLLQGTDAERALANLEKTGLGNDVGGSLDDGQEDGELKAWKGKPEKPPHAKKGDLVRSKRVWGKDKMGDLLEVEARMWGLEPGWEDKQGWDEETNDPPWYMCGDLDPDVRQGRRERARLLKEGNNSYSRFENLGRQICGEIIPEFIHPDEIVKDWAELDLIGCAWAGETARVRRLLLETPVSPDCIDSEGVNSTAMHRAAAKGHLYIVRALIAAGADVDAKDVFRETPLRLAALNAHDEILRVLLAAGADPAIANVDGMTALDTAKEMDEHGAYVFTEDPSPRHRSTLALLQEWERAVRQEAQPEQGPDASPDDAVLDREGRMALAAKLYGKGRVVVPNELREETAIDYRFKAAAPEPTEDEERRKTVRDARAFQRAMARVLALPKGEDGEIKPE